MKRSEIPGFTPEFAPEQIEAFRKGLVSVGQAARLLARTMAREAVRRGILELSEDKSIQPSLRYTLAGSPYGRNSRGKKRWLLEQKGE